MFLSYIKSVYSQRSYLQVFSVYHGNLKGGDNHRTNAKGPLGPADLLKQLGPSRLGTVEKQHRHLAKTPTLNNSTY